jgi:hypothetical protein
MNSVYTQAPGMITRIVDGEGFVISPTRIHHLNATATMVWAIIESPVSPEEIAAAICELFPQVPPETIRGDVDKTLAGLKRDGLVVASSLQ